MNKILINHNQAFQEIATIFKELYEELLKFGGTYIESQWEQNWSLRNFSEMVRSPNFEDENLLFESKTFSEEGIEAAQVKNIENASFCFEQMINLSDELSVDTTYYQIRFEEALSLIEVTDTETIFVSVKKPIYIPELILSTSEILLSRINKKPEFMFKLSSREFEEIVAEIFFRKGFEVELTKATRDGGKDIIAINKALGIPVKYIIECKRYARYRKVSLEYVQRLLGVKISEQANKAILVTTSSFTKDAVKFSNNHFWDLALKDYDQIIKWVKEVL